MNCKSNFVSTNVSFWSVVYQHKIVELINRVFTQNCEWNFVLRINQAFLSVGFILLILWFFILDWFLVKPNCIFCCYIRIWSDFNEIFLIYQILNYFLNLFLLFGSFTFFKSFDNFFGFWNHIIFRIHNVLPVDWLINSQSHWRSDFWGYVGRLNCTNNLMLELSDDIVWEVNYCSCCVKSSWDVSKGKRDSSIFTYFYVINFSIDCLNLFLFWKGKFFCLTFGFRNVFKNVLSFISD